MVQKNAEADFWVKQVLMEMKDEYREFIYPISLLKFEECKNDKFKEGFATDGVTIYYHPKYVLEYKKEELKLQLMHIIVHGLLGHFSLKNEYEYKEYRDFMLDIQVEYVLMKMNFACSERRKRLWEELDDLVQGDYSMSMYRRLCEDKISTAFINYYNYSLRVDTHEMWMHANEENQRKVCMQLWGTLQNALLDENGNKVCDEIMENLANAMRGKGGNGISDAFKVDTGGMQNYRQLLEELLSFCEAEKEDADSIDPMLYQYGLELYGDVPLIEPTEMIKNVMNNSLAIAVDVSGSCTNEETMESFWGATYEFLIQLKEYCKDGNVILLQCDDAIQREQKIELRNLYDIPKEINVQGFGGTSFVPVFNRLKEFERAGDKIGALLYLTDGMGEYPKESPDYPVYFILPNKDSIDEYVKLPKWINVVKLK